MSIDVVQLIQGLVLAAIISVLAFAAGSLSLSGALAAFVVGSIIYGLGGWRCAAVVLVFFGSSSLLTQLTRKQAPITIQKYEKSGRRDAGQVLGNGAIATLCILGYRLMPGNEAFITAFSGGLAAVTADTWATELGALSRGKPRLITNLREQVEPGTSGAITVLGSGAAVLGAAAIAALCAVLFYRSGGPGLIAVLLGGSLGAGIDSILGATVQGMYECTQEHTVTEQHPLHTCGSPTVHRRGLPWLNNDWVNALCSLSGAAIAAGLILLRPGH